MFVKRMRDLILDQGIDANQLIVDRRKDGEIGPQEVVALDLFAQFVHLWVTP